MLKKTHKTPGFKTVKCGCNTCEYFNTDTGTLQGCCASAKEFTHYLEKSLASIRTSTATDHLYAQEEICSGLGGVKGI